MTRATLRVLPDTVLGAHLSEDDARLIEEAGTAFLDRSVWKLALVSLGLPGSLLHPGSRIMARAGKRCGRLRIAFSPKRGRKACKATISSAGSSPPAIPRPARRCPTA
jgi:hypothetical protein